MNEPTSRDLLTASASTLASWIRDGRVSSRHVCEQHIEHARRCNPTVNAIVGERYEAALAEAEEADRSPSDRPFHGVPCTIKESFELSGMPHSGGLVARRSVRAERDAPTVQRLREAGAIPLGVTNVSELCMWMESSNRVYGRTNNPYDADRIAGGSSGGEAAIVASGASPFGLGSDVGGSLRMPAFFNGVFAHKPSSGVVPNAGQFPHATGQVRRLLGTGPITRRAEDLFPLLRVLAGPIDDPEDIASPIELSDPAHVDLSKLRVISVPHNHRIDVSDELVRAQRWAAKHLEGLGATVSEVEIPELRHSLEIWSSLMHQGGQSFAELMGEGRAVAPGRELLRWLSGASPHTLPAIGLALFERGAGLMSGRMRRMVALGDELRDRLGRLLADDAVLLFPSYPRVAPRHHVPIALTFHWVYTAIFNALELPVTQAPLGLDRGLPLGVQIAAGHGHDHLSIAAAVELERGFGGWVPPPRHFAGLGD